MKQLKVFFMMFLFGAASTILVASGPTVTTMDFNDNECQMDKQYVKAKDDVPVPDLVMPDVSVNVESTDDGPCNESDQKVGSTETDLKGTEEGFNDSDGEDSIDDGPAIKTNATVTGTNAAELQAYYTTEKDAVTCSEASSKSGAAVFSFDQFLESSRNLSSASSVPLFNGFANVSGTVVDKEDYNEASNAVPIAQDFAMNMELAGADQDGQSDWSPNIGYNVSGVNSFMSNGEVSNNVHVGFNFMISKDVEAFASGS